MIDKEESLKLPDAPDLRYHPEFRRGYLACLNALIMLNNLPSGKLPQLEKENI